MGDFVLLNYADLIVEISVFFGGWSLPSYHQVSYFMYWWTLQEKPPDGPGVMDQD